MPLRTTVQCPDEAPGRVYNLFFSVKLRVHSVKLCDRLIAYLLTYLLRRGRHDALHMLATATHTVEPAPSAPNVSGEAPARGTCPQRVITASRQQG